MFSRELKEYLDTTVAVLKETDAVEFKAGFNIFDQATDKNRNKIYAVSDPVTYQYK